MDKHEVYIDKTKIVVEGNFVKDAINIGLKGMDIVSYENHSIYAEAYRQLYNKAIEEGNLDEADLYGRVMRNKLKEIKTIISG